MLNFVRKKQRLSSPAYDELLGDFSQECLDAFDKFDELLSQAQPVSKEISSRDPGPSTDADSPFFVGAANIQPTDTDLGKRVAQSPSQTGSTSKALSDSNLNKSIPLDTHLLFKSAKVLKRSRSPVANDDGQAPGTFSSFRSATSVGNASQIDGMPDDSEDKENSGFLIPSAASLAAAKAKLQLWDQEWDMRELPEEASNGRELENDISLVLPLKVASPRRPALAMLPPTSTPRSSSLSTGFESAGPLKSRAFRPPTFKTPANLTKPSIGPSSSQSVTIPPRTPAYNTPTRTRPSILSTQTPKPLGSTPRSLGMTRSSASRFVPPLKSKLGPSQAPNQPGFQTPSLQSKLQKRIYPPAGGRPSPLPSVKQPQKTAMLPPERIAPLKLIPAGPRRKTLASSGLRPQEYSQEELEDMGLNFAELSQIKPSTAQQYCFYSYSSTPPSGAEDAPVLLNSAAAYQELVKDGCRLATEEWVNNHWCLILWKLAGMAALDPLSEQKPETKRWCWKEVMKQLRYRYDVELDGGERPILRKIVAHDTPANLPLVLCVSEILLGENGKTMLEVTDGWYRLRAEVDPALARAVKRGVIREGRKIAVSSARILSAKKDPMEILEAYDSVLLWLPGNSSSLAPWHAKLGLQRERHISTLYSLSPDGGVVSFLDLEILQVLPKAYVESVEQGKGLYHETRSEADEVKAADAWNKRRNAEASRLRFDHEKRVSRYMDYLSRLEGKAASAPPIPEDEDMPNYIDNFYDDLEEHPSALQRLSSIKASDARWLAQLVRQNLDTEHERIPNEIEKELLVSRLDVFEATDLFMNSHRKHALLVTSEATKSW
ncbi:hypothetical protein MD484_g5655, partial [Candolleomyces efflorescens]